LEDSENSLMLLDTPKTVKMADDDWGEGYPDLDYSRYNVARNREGSSDAGYLSLVNQDVVSENVVMPSELSSVNPVSIQMNHQVRINNEDNPRLHGALALVIKVEEWGCVLSTLASASGRYRATWEEMTPIPSEGIGSVSEASYAQYEGVKSVTVSQPVTSKSQQIKDASSMLKEARDKGFVPSGDFCVNCGSADMVRTGACLSCLNCGTGGSCG
jgi:hypothetical protein